MTSQRLDVSLSVGGVIAQTLPNSLSGAKRRLDDLKQAQAADRKESRALTAAIKKLTEGTDEYNTSVARQAELDARIDERSTQIKGLSEETAVASRRMESLRGIMRRSAVTAGVVAASITGVALAIGKVSENVRELDRDAAGAGTDIRGMAREVDALGIALGDADLGRRAAVSLAQFTQDIRLAKQGIGDLDHTLAQRAGINLFELDDTDPAALRRQLVGVVQGATPAQTDILTRLFPDEVFQGLRAEAFATSDVLGRMEQARNRALPDEGDVDSLTRFSSAMESVKSSGGALLREALIPIANRLSPLIDRVTGVVDKVAVWVEQNPRLTATIAGVVGVLGGLVGIGALVVGTLAAMGFASIGLAAVGVPSFGAMTGAIGAFTLALLTNPITGFVVLAVAALTLLVINWDSVVGRVGQGIDFLKSNFDFLLAGIFPFVGIPLLIVRRWDTVTSVVGGAIDSVGDGLDWVGGKLGWLRDNFDLLLAGIFPFVGIPLLIVRRWGAVTGVVGGAIDSVGGGLDWVGGKLGWLKDNFDFLLAGIFPFVGIPLLIVRRWGSVTGAVGTAIDAIGGGLDWVGGKLGWLRDNFDLLLAGIFPFVGIPLLITRRWGSVSDFVKRQVDGVRNHVGGVVSWVVGRVVDMAEAFNSIPLVPDIDTSGLERLQANLDNLRATEVRVGAGEGGASTVTDNSKHENTFLITEAANAEAVADEVVKKQEEERRKSLRGRRGR